MDVRKHAFYVRILRRRRTSVIVAARTAASANGGQIVVTDVVRQLVAGKEFEFTDRGEVSLKGFDEPVRAWTVGWE